MIRMNLLDPSPIRHVTERAGCFQVVEFERDVSVSAESAATAFFASKMNVRKRQLVAELQEGKGVIMQAGAMQMMLGNVSMQSDVRSAGDFIKKLAGSRVTGETTIKPHYTGTGTVVAEPSYRHILLEDLDAWEGGMVIEDGMFLACEDTVATKIITRSSVSSAIAGGEGIFNTCLTGKGIVALESKTPRQELVLVELEDDVLKIDGAYAVAWSASLSFTVEKSAKSIVGAIASGEGLVNVYRGTGRVLVAVVS